MGGNFGRIYLLNMLNPLKKRRSQLMNMVQTFSVGIVLVLSENITKKIKKSIQK